jgi:hemerythrin-like metal-binding protein
LKGHAQSIASPMFKKLENFVFEHYSAEEQLMESTKYPGLTEHRAVHRDLTCKVGEFLARYAHDDQTMSPQLLFFLRDILLDHLLTVDKQYTQWMNEHGIR